MLMRMDSPLSPGAPLHRCTVISPPAVCTARWASSAVQPVKTYQKILVARVSVVILHALATWIERAIHTS